MTISYNKLWKLLIDKNMTKTQLRLATGMTSNALAKLGKDESVQLDILVKICEVLDCNIGDIVDFKINLNNNTDN